MKGIQVQPVSPVASQATLHSIQLGQLSGLLAFLLWWYGLVLATRKGATMPGKTKPRVHPVRVSLWLAVLVFMSACVPGPTAMPTFTPFAPASTTGTPAPVTPNAQATATEAVPVVDTATAVDTGWQAEYFSNDNWQAPPVFTRVDPEPVFDWQEGSPSPDIPADNFTVRWTRCLDLEERYYIFMADGDDFVRVLVDDVLVLYTPVYANVPIPFAVTAGQHCIKVEYRDSIIVARVSFSFQPGEALPSAAGDTAWQAEYFNNTELRAPATYTRNDANPQFDWQLGNAAPGMPIDEFAVRWTRCLEMEGRDYIFTAQADDRIRVVVDDAAVIDVPSMVHSEIPVPITAGNHCIKVEYWETAGPANVSFSFR